MNIIIVLPNQLFEFNKLINKNSFVYIYEHPLYFTHYKYHKLKLTLHRATMKEYYDHLLTTYHCTVKYLEYTYNISKLFKKLHNKRVNMFDPVDHDLAKEFKSLSKKNNIELFMYDTPLFICKMNDLTEYLINNKYHQTTFYIWQRKRLNILLEDNKPIGGKWTYDTENRLPFPQNFHTDTKFNINNSKYVKNAAIYINTHFKNNPGDNTSFYLPTNYRDSMKHLKKFIKTKLNCFGPYQDSVSKDIIFGCHSVLSPLLNIGLITPNQVITKVLKYYETHKHTTKLSSIEGFIRQIIGWREYMRMVYMFEFKRLTTSNHFNHHRKLNNDWYTANINITPINDIIKKVLKYGYAHHIERLMYLGNFMLLSEINPTEIYNWFMIFIDAYPWVMAPNVYGMSQFSSGFLLSTRPYFSSSNYINKMSDYHRKPSHKINLDDREYEWYEIWDALYYNFIHNHKKEFAKNYALASAVSHWNNKSKAEQNKLLRIAHKYLTSYG